MRFWGSVYKGPNSPKSYLLIIITWQRHKICNSESSLAPSMSDRKEHLSRPQVAMLLFRLWESSAGTTEQIISSAGQTKCVCFSDVMFSLEFVGYNYGTPDFETPEPSCDSLVVRSPQ